MSRHRNVRNLSLDSFGDDYDYDDYDDDDAENSEYYYKRDGSANLPATPVPSLADSEEDMMYQSSLEYMKSTLGDSFTEAAMINALAQSDYSAEIAIKFLLEGPPSLSVPTLTKKTSPSVVKLSPKPIPESKTPLKSPKISAPSAPPIDPSLFPLCSVVPPKLGSLELNPQSPPSLTTLLGGNRNNPSITPIPLLSESTVPSVVAGSNLELGNNPSPSLSPYIPPLLSSLSSTLIPSTVNHPLPYGPPTLSLLSNQIPPSVNKNPSPIPNLLNKPLSATFIPTTSSPLSSLSPSVPFSLSSLSSLAPSLPPSLSSLSPLTLSTPSTVPPLSTPTPTIPSLLSLSTLPPLSSLSSLSTNHTAPLSLPSVPPPSLPPSLFSLAPSKPTTTPIHPTASLALSPPLPLPINSTNSSKVVNCSANQFQNPPKFASKFACCLRHNTERGIGLGDINRTESVLGIKPWYRLLWEGSCNGNSETSVFLFDTPSPDDIVLAKQKEAANKERQWKGGAKRF